MASTHLEDLLTTLRFRSISTDSRFTSEVFANAQWLSSRLSHSGLRAEIHPTARHPVVVARNVHRPNRPTVMIYGHYDVQPVDPVEQWQSDPFEPRIENGRIYARGSTDNKGQHMAHLCGISDTLQAHGDLPVNLVFLLEGEEEIGSPNIAAFVREHRELLDVDLVITADGPTHVSGQAAIEFGVRGVASFELHARGANQDLHSGNWGGVAPNPIWTLVQLLATMKNARGEITIDGFYDSVQPPTELEREALANLPVDVEQVLSDLDLVAMDGPPERGFYERLSLWPTLTINGFHGGYGGPGSKTVLPHEAFVKCDIRLVVAQTVDEILGKVKAHVQRYAPDVPFVAQQGMDPSKTPLDSPFAPILRRSVTLGQGEEPLIMPAMGGSLPEYVWTKILGVPAFVIPYANPDEANHAPNENLELERFYKGIKTGAAIMAQLGE